MNDSTLYPYQIYPYGYGPQQYSFTPYDNTATLRAEINELRERVAVLEKQK